MFLENRPSFRLAYPPYITSHSLIASQHMVVPDVHAAVPIDRGPPLEAVNTGSTAGDVKEMVASVERVGVEDAAVDPKRPSWMFNSAWSRSIMAVVPTRVVVGTTEEGQGGALRVTNGSQVS
jgi:hypothetical protein